MSISRGKAQSPDHVDGDPLRGVAGAACGDEVAAHKLPSANRAANCSLPPDLAVRKVLVYLLGSLGDTVVSLPCLHLIERAFPNSERILLTNVPVHAKAPAAADVLGASGLIHGYMNYPVGTRSPRALFRLASDIRRFKPDVLVYMMSIRSTRALLRDKWFFRYAAGVRCIIGIPSARELQRPFEPPLPS